METTIMFCNPVGIQKMSGGGLLAFTIFHKNDQALGLKNSK